MTRLRPVGFGGPALAPAGERRSPLGITLWDEIGAAVVAGDEAALDMLPLGQRVAVHRDYLAGRREFGTVIGRSRGWPMRYDIALDADPLAGRPRRELLDVVAEMLRPVEERAA